MTIFTLGYPALYIVIGAADGRIPVSEEVARRVVARAQSWVDWSKTHERVVA